MASEKINDVYIQLSKRLLARSSRCVCPACIERAVGEAGLVLADAMQFLTTSEMEHLAKSMAVPADGFDPPESATAIPPRDTLTELRQWCVSMVAPVGGLLPGDLASCLRAARELETYITGAALAAAPRSGRSPADRVDAMSRN